MSFVIRSVVIMLAIGQLGMFAPVAWAVWAGPCTEDAKRLCPGQKGKVLHECMKKNESKLSPACKESKERARNLLERCKTEIEKFCPEIKPGKGRVHGCLKKHDSELGKECRDSVNAIPASGTTPAR